jgi:O-6-methylguanine DNA methyltransferase
MRCRSVLSRIDAMRTGELASHEHEPLTEHLAECTSCDESVEDVAMLARTVKALAANPPRSCRDMLFSKVIDSVDTITEGGHEVLVAFNENGLRMIHRGSIDRLRMRYAKQYGRELEPARLPERFRKQVLSALRGEGVEKPQVDWGSEITDIERDVLDTLTQIPKGEVRTYAWVARQVGRPNAVRAVGNICARNIVPFVVPCHRVVPSSGGIGEYAFGSELKRELLRREGVDVDALEALARKGVRFIGSKTTKIVCFPTCKDAKRIREENIVPFHAAEAALAKGFRPCRRCQPFDMKRAS